MKIVGIDPGLKGALAFVDSLAYSVDDVPVCAEIDGQNVINTQEIFRMLNDYRPDIIIYEHQQPQMITSKKTSFIMGRSYQSLLFGINLYAQQFEVMLIEVRPQVWKKTLGLIAPKGTSDANKKKITARFVQTVFPKADIYTPRGRLIDGRSDALAIAEYGRRKYQ